MEAGSLEVVDTSTMGIKQLPVAWRSAAQATLYATSINENSPESANHSKKAMHPVSAGESGNESQCETSREAWSASQRVRGSSP